MRIQVLRIGLVAAAGLFALSYFLVAGQPAVAEEEASPEYVGAVSCARICHKTARQGEQLSIWQASAHATAYESLASEKGKAYAKAAKVDDPQKSDTCLKCHTTGGGTPVEEGVGCEACHGPGSLYKKRSVMKDREAAIKVGLIIPGEKECAACHNADGPHEQAAFNFDERVKKIAHAKPEK
jgi:hypothetical protein